MLMKLHYNRRVIYLRGFDDRGHFYAVFISFRRKAIYINKGKTQYQIVKYMDYLYPK